MALSMLAGTDFNICQQLRKSRSNDDAFFKPSSSICLASLYSAFRACPKLLGLAADRLQALKARVLVPSRNPFRRLTRGTFVTDRELRWQAGSALVPGNLGSRFR